MKTREICICNFRGTSLYFQGSKTEYHKHKVTALTVLFVLVHIAMGVVMKWTYC